MARKSQHSAFRVGHLIMILGLVSVVVFCDATVFQGPIAQTKAGVGLNDLVGESRGAREIQVCIGNVGIILVKIPAGKFKMGSTEGDDSERPLHGVVLRKGFWMGKFTVTQSQYSAVMGQNPGNWKYPDNPVNQVTWDDAKAYISRINAMQDVFDFRLPTEAEWEFACKAGSTGEIYGPLNKIAWYGNSMFGSVHAVGQKEPNAFGLYDMLGNVSEWCQDFYGPYFAEDQADPHGPISGKLRIVRGGSYISSKKYCRASVRDAYPPEYKYRALGFRVVATERGQ